jgi:hypothetical protein
MKTKEQKIREAIDFIEEQEIKDLGINNNAKAREKLKEKSDKPFAERLVDELKGGK